MLDGRPFFVAGLRRRSYGTFADEASPFDDPAVRDVDVVVRAGVHGDGEVGRRQLRADSTSSAAALLFGLGVLVVAGGPDRAQGKARARYAFVALGVGGSVLRASGKAVVAVLTVSRFGWAVGGAQLVPAAPTLALPAGLLMYGRVYGQSPPDAGRRAVFWRDGVAAPMLQPCGASSGAGRRGSWIPS
jgi:hypothetical protein